MGLKPERCTPLPWWERVGVRGPVVGRFCHLYVAFTLQIGQFVRWA